jgi:hypothetical protein
MGPTLVDDPWPLPKSKSGEGSKPPTKVGPWEIELGSLNPILSQSFLPSARSCALFRPVASEYWSDGGRLQRLR